MLPNYHSLLTLASYCLQGLVKLFVPFTFQVSFQTSPYNKEQQRGPSRQTSWTDSRLLGLEFQWMGIISTFKRQWTIETNVKQRATWLCWEERTTRSKPSTDTISSISQRESSSRTAQGKQNIPDFLAAITNFSSGGNETANQVDSQVSCTSLKEAGQQVRWRFRRWRYWSIHRNVTCWIR